MGVCVVSVCVCVCVRYAVSRLTTLTLFEKMWVNMELSGHNWVKQMGFLHI